MKKRNCFQCDTPHQRKKSTFCSMKCYFIAVLNYTPKEYKCKGCDKMFLPKRRFSPAQYCSHQCNRNHLNREVTRKKMEELAKKEVPFSHNAATIEYKDSPTGKAFIGLAKTPLTPADNGIGFKGVKIQSENRELIQCSECGKWFKFLNTHIRAIHGMTNDQYKEKFGLLKGSSLCSDAYSDRVARNMEKAGGIKGAKKFTHNHKFAGKPRDYREEQKNNSGTCELQLKTALVNYIHRFKRLPYHDSRRRGEGYFVYRGVLKHRYGSFNRALAHYGLPTRTDLGRRCLYVFPDETTITVTKGNFEDYDHLYHRMLSKCPVLSQ